MRRSYRYFDFIMAGFVAVLLTSNIASSAKIVDWGMALPLIGLPLAFDAGTLLFPISYIFGDILTEVYGYAASRRVIWAGFALAGRSRAASGETHGARSRSVNATEARRNIQAISRCRASNLRCSISGDSGWAGSGSMHSTGQTTMHCGSSKWPTHSVHFGGAIS